MHKSYAIWGLREGGGLMSFRLSQKYIDFCRDMNCNADFLEGT